MVKFFFVPANRLHKVDDIKILGVDYLIIDLEDAVKTSERQIYTEQLSTSQISRDFFVRLPIYDLQDKLDFELLKKLKSYGYKNFVIPKIQNITHYDALRELLNKEDKIILLVETPLFLLQLTELLTKNYSEIVGLGLGSHDLMNTLGAKHEFRNLDFYRHMILLNAKAFNLTAIDVASMELKDKEEFKSELKQAFEQGFDAKLFIHPWQIRVFNETSLYTEQDLNWAKLVHREYNKVNDSEEFNPIVIKGVIIEKPHLERMFKILKYYENESQ